MSLVYQAKEQIAVPPEVDTMREEICPVCGSDDSYVGDKCSVCGFEKPPSIFMDPDTSLAQNVNLKQDDQEDAADDGAGELQCPNCGMTFPSAEALNAAGDPHLAPAAQTIPAEQDLEVPEVPQGAEEEQDPDEVPEDNQMAPPPPQGQEEPPGPPEDEEEEDEELAPDGATDQQPPPGAPPEEEPPEEGGPPEDLAGPPNQEEDEQAEQEQVDPEAMAEEQYAADEQGMAQTGYEEGDICPNCGEGLLQPVGTDAAVPAPGAPPEVEGSDEMPQGGPRPFPPGGEGDDEPEAAAEEDEEASPAAADEEGGEAEDQDEADEAEDDEEDGQPPWLKKKKAVHTNYRSSEGAGAVASGNAGRSQPVHHRSDDWLLAVVGSQAAALGVRPDRTAASVYPSTDVRRGERSDPSWVRGGSRLGDGVPVQGLRQPGSSGSGDQGGEYPSQGGVESPTRNLRQGSSVHSGEYGVEEDTRPGSSGSLLQGMSEAVPQRVQGQNRPITSSIERNPSTMPNPPRPRRPLRQANAIQEEHPAQRSSVRTALHASLNAQASVLRQMTAACHQERCLRLAAEARISTLERQMLRFAQLAGADADPELRSLNEEGYRIHAGLMQKAASVHTADQRNPASPVPEGAPEAPVVTEQEAAEPAARADVTQLGATPVTDVSADATVAVDEPYGTMAFEPMNLNEVDVTAPVQNTQGHLPPEQTIIPVEVRVGDPDDPQPSYGWTIDGGNPSGQTGGSVGSGAPTGSAPGSPPGVMPGTRASRSDGQVSLGALRLARLRMQAGIAPPNQDDLSIAASIQDNPDMSIEAVNTEIKTLSQVLSVAAPNGRVASANRRLVPRPAQTVSEAPSLAPSGEGPIRAHASTGQVRDDEMLFE
jgi:hypothetical protein